jgi:hypothetical protein
MDKIEKLQENLKTIKAELQKQEMNPLLIKQLIVQLKIKNREIQFVK